MPIKFMSLVEEERGKLNFEIHETPFRILLFRLRYTEIWSDDRGSKSIKLADPKLGDYDRYPELFLVETKFCVKP